MEIEQINRYVGTKIKEHRQYLGLKQEELAKKIGVGKTTISNYEVGLRSPKKPQLIKLSEVFGIAIDDFFPKSDLQERLTASSVEEKFQQLTPRQQKNLLEFAKYDLDKHTLRTLEMMLKADEDFRDKIFSYAEYEYFKYEKDLESKKSQHTGS